MKLLRNCVIGLLALLLVFACVLWFFPARWAAAWIEPQLHGLELEHLHGSVWDGRADRVLGADGQALGRLQWRLSRRSLLGQGRLQASFEGPRLAFSGDLERLSAERVQVRDVQARADLGSVGSELQLPWGQPRGNLSLTVQHAVLQGGWPLQLEGLARWSRASMHTNDGEVMLGTLQARAQATNGVVQVRIHDDGGPLFVDGEMQISPLGWRLDATLRARQTDPVLRRWLATLGPLSADGSVHLRHHGGLAAPLSHPSTN